jgi:hypothetical protein
MIPVKEFFTAGRAIFTIEVPQEFMELYGTKPHYTYRIRIKEEKDKAPKWYVDYLSGSDNLSNYSYLGRLNPETGNVLLTNNSRVTEEAWNYRLLRRALARIFENKPNKITKAGFNLHHEGKCGRCGRALTVPESIQTGLGPICAKQA